MTHFSLFFLSSVALSFTTLFLLLILLRFGTTRVHKIWVLFNISVFIWAVGASIASSNLLKAREATYLLWKINDSSVTFISVFLLHMAVELTKSKRYAPLIAAYIQAALFTILIFTTDTIAGPTLVKRVNHFYMPNAGTLFPPWFAIWIAIVSYAHYILIKHYLFQSPLKSKHLLVLLLSMAIGFISGSVNFLLSNGVTDYSFGNLGIVVYCLMVTYAIFRHQLLGVEVVFKQGLLYSILIGTISILYISLVLALEILFRDLLGYKSYAISAGSAILIAFLFNPLKDRIQKAIDRIFFKKSTNEIALENELLKEELCRSDRLRAISTLALGLAHEVKNPLSTLKTFAEFLSEKHTDNDFIRKFSSIIPAEVDRINNIVHKLLNFSKPNPPIFQNVNISQLITDILVFLNNDFLKNKIVLSEDFGAPNLAIKADANQIKQALFNFLNNSKEAMPNGGTITIKTYAEDTFFVAIEIIDTGCGISNDKIKQIFDPFFTTKDEGTGLGLSICHQIIKNHSGRIEIDSEVNRGTTVRIFLPRAN